MAINPAKRQVPNSKISVIEWLLDSDPSIRWQVMRDLTDAPAEEVAAERARAATEGGGAWLLALQPHRLRAGGLARARTSRRRYAGGHRVPSPRAGVPPRAPSLPPAINR